MSPQLCVEVHHELSTSALFNCPIMVLASPNSIMVLSM